MPYDSDFPMLSKFPGRCACGERVAAGAAILYRKGPGVVGCARCKPAEVAAAPAPRSSAEAPVPRGNTTPGGPAAPGGVVLEMTLDPEALARAERAAPRRSNGQSGARGGNGNGGAAGGAAGGGVGDVVTIRVTVRAVKSIREGWAALSVVTPKDAPLPTSAPRITGPFSASGAIPAECCAVGAEIQLTGQFSRSERWGWELKAASASLAVADSDAGVLAFLDRLPGVGRARGEAILERFGRAETLAILERGGAELTAIRGITAERAAEMAEAYASHRALRDVLIYLGEIGLGPGQTRVVIDEWGGDARRNIEENPYRLMLCDGFGFKRADEIATGRCGITASDPRRCAAAALHVIDAATGEGHCWSPEGVIAGEGDARDATARAAKQTGVTAELLRRGIDLLTKPRREIKKGAAVTLPPLVVREPEGAAHGAAEGADRIFPAKLRDAEQRVAFHLARLIAAVEDAAPLSVLPAALDGLHENQAEAVRLAARSGVLVVTGNPGTGKTTCSKRVLATLIAACGSDGVALAAPTGKAALRLSEQTGLPASTIHRLLEWSPVAGGFTRNEGNPLEAEIVLTDETSMIDLELAASLLAAIPSGARLVVVGDVDQLPSVGPGAFLRDIITSGTVPCVRLTHIFRQALDSAIPWLARSINEGRPIDFNALGRDVAFLDETDEERAADEIVDLVTRRIPASLGVAAADVQVLSPQHAGPLGTIAMNATLQRALRPIDTTRDAYVTIGAEGLAAECDKVIATRNNYNLEIRNGEVARVVAVARDARAGLNVEVLEDELGGEIRTTETVKRAAQRDAAESGGDDSEFFAAAEPDRRERKSPILLVADFGTAKAPRFVGFTRPECYELQLAYCVTVHKFQGSQAPAVVMPAHKSQTFMLTRALAYTGITRAEKMIALVGDREVLGRAARNTRGDDRRTGLAARLAAAVPVAREKARRERGLSAQVAAMKPEPLPDDVEPDGASCSPVPFCAMCGVVFLAGEPFDTLPNGDDLHRRCARELRQVESGEPAPSGDPDREDSCVWRDTGADRPEENSAEWPGADEIAAALLGDATCADHDHVFDVAGMPCSACGALVPPPASGGQLTPETAALIDEALGAALDARRGVAARGPASRGPAMFNVLDAAAGREPWSDRAPTPLRPAEPPTRRGAEGGVAVENIAATHCVICGRELIDAPSIERGIGPVCAARLARGAADAPVGEPDVSAKILHDAGLQDDLRRCGEATRRAVVAGEDPARAVANALVFQLSQMFSARKHPVFRRSLGRAESNRAAALCRALAALGFRRVALTCGRRLRVTVFPRTEPPK